MVFCFFFFFQAEDGIRDLIVTGVQTCALPISILESGGWAAAVSDAELVAAIQLLAEEVGIFTETAGGVTVAAALALAAEGRFSPDDEVVLCITGNGLKTIDAVAAVLPQAPLIAPRVAEVRALVEGERA